MSNQKKCDKCAASIKDDSLFCEKCSIQSKSQATAENSSNTLDGCADIFMGLFWGLIFGFCGLFVLLMISPAILKIFYPNFYNMWVNSSMPGMGLLFISLFCGMIIYPFVRLIFSSKAMKGKILFFTVFTHLVLCMIIFLVIVNNSDWNNQNYQTKNYPEVRKSYGILPTVTNESNTETIVNQKPTTTVLSVPTQTPKINTSLNTNDITIATPANIITPTPTPTGYHHYVKGRQSLWNDENFIEAIEHFNKYIQLNDADAKGYEQRGHSYHHLAIQLGHKEYIDPQIILNHFNNALIDYDKTIELNQSSANVYGQRGHVHRLLDNHQNAIHDYEKHIELDSTDPWPHHYLGMVYVNINEYELAIESWEKYIELRLIHDSNWLESEQSRNTYNQMGWAYIELHKYKKSIEYFDHALLIDSNFDSAITGKFIATENTKSIIR